MKIGNVATALERLSGAVDAMQRETVSCRRNLTVFRARMDSVGTKVAAMQDTLVRTMDILLEAETEARRAADIFRATAQGHSAV